MNRLPASGAIAGSKELWTCRAAVAPPPRTAPPRPDGRASLSPDPASPAATLLRGARACLALLGAAALLALAAPAQAQTEVWSATLTPVTVTTGLAGCYDVFTHAACSSTAILSDNDFTYDSTNYTVTALFGQDSGSFNLFLSPAITTATGALTLVVDSTSLVLANATTSNPTDRIWTSTGISLTVGTAVAVSLVSTTTTTSSDATLSALALADASDDSAIAISPVFASGTTSYTASVDSVRDGQGREGA